MKYSEEDMKRVLGQEPAESTVIDRSMEEAYQKIRSAESGESKAAFQKSADRHHRNGSGGGNRMCSLCQQPGSGRKIPLIGHIFPDCGRRM